MEKSKIKNQNGNLKCKAFYFAWLVFILTFALCTFNLRSVHASVILEPTSYLRGSTLSQGLVGYWTFNNQDNVNGVMQDKSGNSNNGNFVNIATSTFFAPGKLGQAGNFDGVDDYVLGSASAADMTTNSFSVSFWMKFNSSTIANSQLVSKRQASGNNGYEVYTVSDGHIGMLICDGTVLNGNLGTLPADGKWHYIVVVYNRAGNATAYVDTVAGATPINISARSASITSTSQLFFGRTSINSSNFFPGRMDDVRIYNRALTSTEVRQLYLQGGGVALEGTTAGATRGCTISSLNCGLVGYWTMNNQDMNWVTGKAFDRSGNGNDGQLLAMSTTTSSILGKVGQALSFRSAKSQEVLVPTLTIPSSVSVSVWEKTNTNTANQFIIAATNGLNLGIGSSNASISANGCLSCGAVGTAIVNDKKWHHIVGVITGNVGYIYVDGVLNGTASQTYSGQTSTVDIGQSISNAYFDGTLDDVRLYGRALSAAEIRQLYLQGGGVALEGTTGGASRGCAISSLNCGLVGYWTFNNQDMNWATGKAFDKSGSGNNGQLLNMSTTTSPTPGKMGQGLKFTGTHPASTVTQPYVDTNTVFGSVYTSGTKTMSEWVKAGSTAPGLSFMIPRTFGNTGFGFTEGGGNWIAQYFDNTTFLNQLSSTNPIVVGQWTMLTLVQNHATVSFYVNGVLNATGANGADPSAETSNVNTFIGALNNGDGTSGFNFNGAIDDVRIYNRALSAQEVQQLYNQGK